MPDEPRDRSRARLWARLRGWSALLAGSRARLRQRLALTTVECGIAPCRRFHLDHPWLRRAAGVYLGQRWYCSPACFRDAVEGEVRTLAARRAQGSVRRLPRMPWRLILLTRGEVTEAQLEEARGLLASDGASNARGSGRADDLGAMLVRLGYATEEQVAQARAAEAGSTVHLGGQPPHMSGRHARELLLPAMLLEEYGAVVVHLDHKHSRLLLGFVLRQEPALLGAVSAVTGLRTEGCFLTPTAYARLWGPGAGPRAADDTGASLADDPVAIAGFVVDQVMRRGADQVHLARVGDRLWLRLAEGEAHRGSGGADFVFCLYATPFPARRAGAGLPLRCLATGSREAGLSGAAASLQVHLADGERKMQPL